METITVEVPYVSPSWNDIYAVNNFWSRKRIVDDERERIGWHLKVKLKPVTGKVNISIRHCKKHPYDGDNVCAKVWIDAMKDIGVLQNDDHRYVGWVHTRCDKGDEEKTIITIEPDHED